MDNKEVNWISNSPSDTSKGGEKWKSLFLCIVIFGPQWKIEWKQWDSIVLFALHFVCTCKINKKINQQFKSEIFCFCFSFHKILNIVFNQELWPFKYSGGYVVLIVLLHWTLTFSFTSSFAHFTQQIGLELSSEYLWLWNTLLPQCIRPSY